MLFSYLHQMWIDNTSESLGYLDKNTVAQSVSIVNGGEMYSAAGNVSGWSSSRLQTSMSDAGEARPSWL
jgi:hypothetical protein